MDGAAHAIATRVAHREALGDHALTGESGVAVDQEWQHAVGKRWLDAVLGRAHHTQHDGVDGLEVARVGRHLDWQGRTRWRFEGALGAEVILHVAGTLHRARVDVALELVEDLVVALAHDVAEHVQTTTVCHAEHRAVHLGVCCRREDGVEDRDRGLCAFETEALGADVLGGEEALEGFCCVQSLEDAALVDGVVAHTVTLDALLNPALFLGRVDVHVLDTDRAAVGVAQVTEDLAECRLAHATDATGEELAVEVPDGESIGGGVEFGRHLGFVPTQRIEVGDQVAAHAVHADQRGDLHLLIEHRVFGVEIVRVLDPLHRLVRHTDGREHLVIEAVLPDQRLVHALQEQTALGALDDAVVVRARDRDDLGHTDSGE